MQTLTQELIAAVDKSLPQMVGDQLKARLTKADQDADIAGKVPALEDMVKTLKAKLEGIEKREANATNREAAVTTREHVVELNEKLIILKELHAKERVQEMRGVVQDVFANARFKYTEAGSVNTPQGYQSVSKTVESTVVPGQ